MHITDRIYGKIEITHPLIIDLISSRPFQRLKSISQDGAVHYIQPHRTTTRYDHSIGTWYLSCYYKRPLEEQIASLLHDLPHTAFSHVIDFVMDDKNHEYHDHFIKDVIINSEIPEILKNYDVELSKILEKESYPLLDNKLPDISVDRFDYFMRDGFTSNFIPKETIALFLKSVKEKNEKFYFEDIKVAGLFSVMFMNCSRLIWLDPTSHGSFFLMSESLKLALKKQYITKKDFFGTDAVLMQKLLDTKDNEILHLLNRLQPGKEFQYAPEKTAEFFGPNKPRFVDPWVLHDKKLVQLSDLIPGMKEYFAEYTKTYANLGVIQRNY